MKRTLDFQHSRYGYNQYGDLTDVYLPPVADPSNPDGPFVSPHYQYAYDTYGDLIAQTDPLGHTTTYRHDPFGDKVSEALPQLPGGTTPTETWAYDALQQLRSTTDFDGHVIDDAYDVQGRLTEKNEYANAAAERQGPAHALEVVTYSYDNHDASHRRYDTVTVADASGYDGGGTKVTTSYYDTEGQLVEVDSPQGDIHYAYDPATGQKTEVTTANTDITYAYDDLGQLTTVTADTLDGSAASQVTTYAYDLDGHLLTTDLPNGTVEARAYDTLGRLQSIATTVSSTGATIFSATYTRDLDGHITLDQEMLNGTAQAFDDTYDADGRLIRQGLDASSANPRLFTYAYDLAGNRTGSTDSAAAYGQQALTYAYDPDGRLTSVRSAGAFAGAYSVDYTYDAAGDTLTATTTGGGSPQQTVTDSWDLEGRLVGVVTAVDGTTQSVADSYDDSGDRVSETAGGRATTYLNDPTDAYDRVLEEYSGGMLAATYVRGLDLLFQDRTGADGGTSSRSYYAVDALGSTRALTNSAGAVTDTDTYDAYGDTMPGQSSGHTTNEFTYAGYQADAATGQYDTESRIYDAAAGRFTSRDSFDGSTSDPITQNHYAYADANPIDMIDPSGHDGELADVLTAINEGITLGVVKAQIAVSSVLAANPVLSYIAVFGGQALTLYGLVTDPTGALMAGPASLVDDIQAFGIAASVAGNKAYALFRGVDSLLHFP